MLDVGFDDSWCGPPHGVGRVAKGAREGPGNTQAQGESVPRRCGEVKSKPRRSGRLGPEVEVEVLERDRGA